MRDIQNLIDVIRETVNSHKLETAGEYARWIWQDEKGERNLGKNEYGCADAANILYTINYFPKDTQERQGFVKAIQSMQDPKTGLFKESTHSILHTTAHCTAALELFDAVPKYPFTGLNEYKTIEGLKSLLENLDWKKRPWPESHKGAGIYAALKLAGETSKEWEDAYFNWLWEHADSETGMWKNTEDDEETALLFTYMGAAFHYLFNIEYANMPLRYPEKMIDTCIELYKKKQIGSKAHYYDNEKFGKYIGFLEIDWIYCITRSRRQCGYRFNECTDVLREFAENYIDWLYSIDHKTHDDFNDLHRLFGTTCALAELQSALPGEIKTDRPMRLVLDRRPFI